MKNVDTRSTARSVQTRFLKPWFAEVGFDEEIDMIIEKAKRTQEMITTYRCGPSGGRT